MFREIIFIAGMPRSGTSWLSQIFDSSPEVRFRLSPIFSYEFKNSVNENSTGAEWNQLFTGAYLSESAFMDQTERRRTGQYPTFIKNKLPRLLVIKDTRFHNLLGSLLQQVKNVKLIVIVRNPCGAIHSWLTAPREFPKDADPASEWRSGKCRKNGYGEFWGFDDWVAVTRLHLSLAEKYPGRVKIIRYEDMVSDSIAETKSLFSEFGIEYGDATDKFLLTSQSKHIDSEYAVFKNPAVVDRWRVELDPGIRKKIIEEVRGTELARFL